MNIIDVIAREIDESGKTETIVPIFQRAGIVDRILSEKPDYDALLSAYGNLRDSLYRDIDDVKQDIEQDYYSDNGDEANNYGECFINSDYFVYHSDDVVKHWLSDNMPGLEQTDDIIEHIIKGICGGYIDGDCKFSDSYWHHKEALITQCTGQEPQAWPLSDEFISRIKDLEQLRESIELITDEIESGELLLSYLEVGNGHFEGFDSDFCLYTTAPQQWYFSPSIEDIYNYLENEEVI